MPELLLELLSEEIPARMQARAAADLKRLVTEGLEKQGLAFERAEAFHTPRRLTLVVDGLPAKQPDRTEERKGPRVGAPEKAIEGFLKSANLDSLDQCEIREVKGAAFYFVVDRIAGLPTERVLGSEIPDLLGELPWPKSMRWGGAKLRWVRPLHEILALFGGKPLDGAVDTGSLLVSPDERPELGRWVVPQTLQFGNYTVGHRFLAPQRFFVTDFADYAEKLRQAYVIVDPAERREIIAREAARLAAAEGLKLVEDDVLLDEVTGLVEWPLVLMGRIDDAFMAVPDEVLASAMRTHQKYFSLVGTDGALAPRFIVVANMVTEDGGQTIVAGNERVLRARLADAKFFWDQDRKASLASRTTALKDIVFHAKLGSLDDKVDRVQALAAELARHVPGADGDRVRSAARLAKADLTTEMVGEFPDLQGVMGRYYALHDGEHAEVADAIAEHYAPRGPDDACPTAPVSVVVALADKIDTLVGFWAIDEKPTGSKDPYALRRAALGVIRLILENGLRLPLTHVFAQANHLIAETASGIVGDLDPNDLLAFFADRLKVHLRETGVRHDLVSAVFAIGGEDDLARLMAQAAALNRFLRGEDGANLLVAYRRAANIVRIEEKKDKTGYADPPCAGRLVEPQEKALHEALHATDQAVEAALAEEDFEAAMASLAALRVPVDRFFDDVTVNCDEPDLRANRLRLLSRIRASMDRVADFSKIEG